MKAVQLTFADKSVPELENIFLFNLKQGSVNANQIISMILDKKIDKSEREKFEKRVVDFLCTNDCHSATYYPAGIECLASVLSNENMTELCCRMLRQEKLEIACNLSERVVWRAAQEDKRYFAEYPQPFFGDELLADPIFKPVIGKIEDLLHLHLTSTTICGKEYKKVVKKLLPAYCDYSEKLAERFKYHEPVLHEDHMMMMSFLSSMLSEEGPRFIMLSPSMLTDYGKERVQGCLDELEKFNFEGANRTDHSYYRTLYGANFTDSCLE